MSSRRAERVAKARDAQARRVEQLRAEQQELRGTLAAKRETARQASDSKIGQRREAARQALRSKLADRREAAQQALERRRAAARARAGRKKRPRRRRWWLAAVALLLLLLLRDCSCNEPVSPPPPAVAATPEEPVPEEVIEPTPARAPHRGRLATRHRPIYESELLDPLPWLASYRMQVSARSPRLAECFVGAARPGTLKWTASVEPDLGQVSEQTLEPTLLSDELTRQQRSCVFEVLSVPAYQLESDGERSTPVRVGMVSEF